eukprot:scaffold33481_cov48-Attheya_sp.AAC.1
MGGGGVDSSNMLAFFDLPNAGGAKSTFTNIEKVVGPIQREVCREAIEENLIEEVRLTLLEEPEQGVTFEEWMKGRKDGTPLRVYPKLTYGLDMGWQQAQLYFNDESLAALGPLLGMEFHLPTSKAQGHGGRFTHTGKPIGFQIYAKQCQFCDNHNAESDGGVPDHDCPQNFKGSSKSMESKA